MHSNYIQNIKKLALLWVWLPLSMLAQAQHWCASDAMRKKAIETHPAILDATDLLEQHTQDFIRARAGNRDEEDVKIIPVVFHIIHMYGEENISDEQIYDQMEVLNRDFRKLNSDTADIVHGFDTLAADSRIEFRLAQRDFLGDCTNGIERIASIETNIGDDGSKLHQWPRNMYLNIWVVSSMQEGVAGYAYYPDAVVDESMSKADGIIILHQYIGRIGTGNEFRSRALTHEIGHYLNLQHPWGNNNDPGELCGDDLVEDTPETEGHTDCDLDGQHCNIGVFENTQNYMDYSYCSVMFTEGQKERMHAALTSTIAERNNLWSATNLALTGVDGSSQCSPDADFYASAELQGTATTAVIPLLICPGEEVTFHDNSANGDATSWLWTFEDGEPSTSEEEEPVVQFNTPGEKTITLTVTNAMGSSTKTIYHMIHVAWPTDVNGLLSESFESQQTYDKWIPRNLDQNNTNWQRVTNAGSTGTSSVMLNASEAEFSFIDTGDNDIDELVSPSMDLSLVSNAGFTFKYAYATKSTAVDEITEKLEVFSSRDCGKSWTLRETIEGFDLVTAGNDNGFFVPEQDEWVEVAVDLPSNVSDNNIRFKFVYTSSDASNNIYIDDVNIQGTVGVGHISGINFLDIYPNPANTHVQVSYDLKQQDDVSIQLLTLDGRMVEQHRYNHQGQGNQQVQLNLSQVSSGIYFIRIQTGSGVITQKLVIK